MPPVEVIREPQQVTILAANGCAIVEFPAPHVALMICEGIAYEDFVEPMAREIEQRCPATLVLAVDASALSSYETGFRKRWTDWLAARKPNAVLVLVQSRLVAMGVAVANAVLGGAIRSFNSRAEFERALAVEREHHSTSVSA